MKKTLLTVFLLGSLFASAQEMTTTSDQKMETSSDYDHWSIELSGGVHKAGRNFAPGYFTNSPNFFQASIGARYMFNPKFGMKLDLGYTTLDNDEDSLPFETDNYRGSLQGVVNFTNVLGFNEWTNTFGLLFHAGAGYSFNKYKAPNDIDDKDQMLHFIAGVTPMIKISNSIALTGDASIIGNVRQTETWDGTQLNNVSGFDGSIFNFSVGVNFYLGGAEKHADWYSEQDMQMEKISELESRLAKVETDMIDTDQDGVADYLDREPNTMSGVTVNTKGVAVDKNKNGIPDEIESALDSRYSNTSSTTTGSGDGVGVRELLDKGYVNVYFDFNSTKPANYSLDAINYLIKYMVANPSSKADLIGYADELGSDNYNKDLSEKRAKMVYDILVASGVDAGRLSYQGGGEDASVDKGSSPARQLVRRVTFKLK